MPEEMLAAVPVMAGDCGVKFCHRTDGEAALIAGEGAANARLVAVKAAIVALMRHLRRRTCSFGQVHFLRAIVLN